MACSIKWENRFFTFWVLYHGSHQHCSEKTPFWFVIFDFWVPTFSVQLWDDRLGLFFLLLAKGIKRIELQLGRYSKVSGFKSAWINKPTIKQVLESNEKTNAAWGRSKDLLLILSLCNNCTEILIRLEQILHFWRPWNETSWILHIS